MVSSKERKELEAKKLAEKEAKEKELAEKKKLEDEKKEKSKSSKLEEVISELSINYPFLFKAFSNKFNKPLKEEFKNIKELNEEFNKFRGA